VSMGCSGIISIMARPGSSSSASDPCEAVKKNCYCEKQKYEADFIFHNTMPYYVILTTECDVASQHLDDKIEILFYCLCFFTAKKITCIIKCNQNGVIV